MTSTSRSRSISGYFTAASGSVPNFAAACSLKSRARSPAKSGPVWVWVAVIAMFAAGMPVRWRRQRADLARHRLRHAQQVAHDDRRPRRPLLKHDGLGLQRIAHPGVEALVEVAVHPVAGGRRDVDLGEAHLKR